MNPTHTSETAPSPTSLPGVASPSVTPGTPPRLNFWNDEEGNFWVRCTDEPDFRKAGEYIARWCEFSIGGWPRRERRLLNLDPDCEELTTHEDGKKCRCERAWVWHFAEADYQYDRGVVVFEFPKDRPVDCFGDPLLPDPDPDPDLPIPATLAPGQLPAFDEATA
jgi:hypothetical protein